MNPYNFVRVQSLELVSIETLAILVAVAYFGYLLHTKQASLEAAMFLAFPFSDFVFRFASIGPSEVLEFLFILANYKKIRLTYVGLIAGLFILYGLISFAAGINGVFAVSYSIRFLLTALVFSILARTPFRMPLHVLRFMVIFCFAVSTLQVGLWLAGLPIHGIFYDGLIPRTKGLAQEPNPWSVYLVSLFPFIFHFRLGRIYWIMNLISLTLTMSTEGFVVLCAFLLIRMCLSGFRFRLKVAQARMAAGAILAGLVLMWVRPEVVENGLKIFHVFDKVAVYAYELSEATGLHWIPRPGLEQQASGRGEDVMITKALFPTYGLLGIGSFSAREDLLRDKGLVPSMVYGPQNTYLMFIDEIGVTGCILLLPLLVMHYRVLMRYNRPEVRDFVAYSLSFLVMIAGTRVFAFHETWYTQACVFRLNKKSIAHMSSETDAAEETV